MSGEAIALLVFGGPWLILCLIYALYAARRRQQGERQSSRSTGMPRIYVSQQVPSVFDTFKCHKK